MQLYQGHVPSPVRGRGAPPVPQSARKDPRTKSASVAVRTSATMGVVSPITDWARPEVDIDLESGRREHLHRDEAAGMKLRAQVPTAGNLVHDGDCRLQTSSTPCTKVM